MNQQIIERIKKEAYLPDIVSENLTLRRSGNGYVCLCPFHADKSPSMHLYPPTSERNYWTYKCYGCGKTGDVLHYVQERDGIPFVEAVNALARRLNIPLGGSYTTPTGSPSRPRETPPRQCYLSVADLVVARQSAQSDFASWLSSVFPTDAVTAAVERYHLGATTDGHIIFWQVDEKGFVRSAKVMKYGQDGHRLRNGQEDAPDWIHARLLRACKRDATWAELFHEMGKADPVQLDKWQLAQVFFGLHLLHGSPSSMPVAVVESEKTAVVMSLLAPGFLWLACGGYSSLAVCLRNSLDALAGRRILIVPDKSKDGQDFCAGWRKVCSGFPSLNVTVTDELERTDLAAGEDIADLFLRAIPPRPRKAGRTGKKVRGIVTDPDEFTPFDWSKEFDEIMSGPPSEACPF